MYGVVTCMIALRHLNLFWLLILIMINLMISLASKRLLGAGDTGSLGWCIIGFGTIWLPMLYIFLMFFVFFLVVYFVSKKVLDIHGKTPGMIVVLGSFLITVIVFI